MVAAPVPTTPAALVAQWRDDERSLSAALAAWNRTGTPPRSVSLPAQSEQRVIRFIALHPRLAHRVERQVPSLTADVAARVDLDRLGALTPPPRGRLRLGPAAPPQRLMRWYREAERRFGVRWEVLAAINFVESAFGRVRNTSAAGAQGPMQFLPATWSKYGLGGDVNDAHDAILGAANDLAANGARRDERGALNRYNRSSLYVDAVSRYANRMGRDPAAFYAYYVWRVYWR